MFIFELDSFIVSLYYVCRVSMELKAYLYLITILWCVIKFFCLFIFILGGQPRKEFDFLLSVASIIATYPVAKQTESLSRSNNFFEIVLICL